MTAPLPDPVRLDPPPGDPHALAALGVRLDAVAAFLGDLGEQLSGAPAAGCGWTGMDAAAADAQVARVAALALDAAGALRRAGDRVTRHAELLEDSRQRLARLGEEQTEDYGATVLRMGVIDPGTGLLSADAAAVGELHAAEAARRQERVAILTEVEHDAAATAAVLAGCTAVAGGDGGADDEQRIVRYLEDLLPGWHADRLEQRGRDFVAALSGSEFAREDAARALLPWAGNGAVAAEVLTGLGADGIQEVLRQLGDGSLSAGSALAGVMAAVLGAPVPTGAAAEVARVRDVRLVDPDDVRSPDADQVALGMGVVLAAARRQGLAGPPVATVREWGRQIIGRERELGSEWIVSSRPQASPAPPGDPLAEVLDRLAEADGRAQAAELLGGEPTWTHLLSRSWEDGGAAFTAVVERAAREPGSAGDLVVRSGLRALAVGLDDDGDPAGWTVDRGTATVVAPALAEALSARPEVVVEPLARAASGEGEQDRLVLRGLGYLSTDPTAATVLDRTVADAGPGGSPAGAVPAGYAAVREYGQRLAHALDEFAAQERAEDRGQFTDLVVEGLSLIPKRGEALAKVVAGVAVLADFDGTWDASADDGQHVPMADAVRAARGTPEAEAAYREVSGVVGDPTAPVSPGIDVWGLVSDFAPGTARTHRDAVILRIGDLATEVLGD